MRSGIPRPFWPPMSCLFRSRDTVPTEASEVFRHARFNTDTGPLLQVYLIRCRTSPLRRLYAGTCGRMDPVDRLLTPALCRSSQSPISEAVSCQRMREPAAVFPFRPEKAALTRDSPVCPRVFSTSAPLSQRNPRSRDDIWDESQCYSTIRIMPSCYWGLFDASGPRPPQSQSGTWCKGLGQCYDQPKSVGFGAWPSRPRRQGTSFKIKLHLMALDSSMVNYRNG